MTTIATLAVRLIADVSEYTSKMSKASATAQETANKIGKSMQDTGASIMNMGKNMTTFVTLPILGAGISAIKMASDLEETKNKVNVVFGSMSKDVLEWSQNSSTAMGLSQNSALSGAATFGNLFTTMGLGSQPTAEMSTSLVKLASDLGSFNNMNPTEVLQNLQSGIIGQAEPMYKFGVDLREATVKAKAMQLGLVDASGAVSQAGLIQARYALIMEQTTTAQGDFANTSQGAANLLRTLQAQLVDAAGALGLQLLPYVIQGVQWLSGLIQKFQALTPEQQKWILVVLGVVAAVGPLLVIVGSLVTAIGAIIPVVTAVGGALLTFAPYLLVIAAVAGLLYLAWTNNWGGIQEKTAAVIAYIKGLIAGAMQFIQDLTSGKLGWISKLWKDNWETVEQIFKIVSANIRILQRAWHALLTGDWHGFGQQMRFLWENIWAMIKIVLGQAWDNLKTIFPKIIDGILNFFKHVDWGHVGIQILEGIGKGLLGALPLLLSIVKKVGAAVMEMLKGFFMIRSPSIKMEKEIGWQLAAGTARGWERGIDTLMPGTMPKLMPASVGSVSGMSAAGGGVSSSAPISVMVDYHPMISTADEHEARFVLAPMIQDEIRKNQKR